MSEFYYEHIGHMQCCEVTLSLYKHIYELAQGKINIPVSIKEIIEKVCKDGYSKKIVLSEMDRFFYGGVAQDQHNGFCIFTYIGLDYYNQLIKEASDQKNIIALLVRESRLKNRYNITLQETTFFNPIAYKIVDKYSLRSGGARDFIKSVDLLVLNNLIRDLSNILDEKSFEINNIDDLIMLVKNNGKYWASVGGKYSWIIFTQRYYVNVDFDKYKMLIDAMKRPVEWGGNSKDLTHDEVLNILESNTEITNFLNNFIIRRLSNGNYRLTCPGFLMFERISKGRIIEFELRKVNSENLFELLACNASDCIHQDLYNVQYENNSTLMKLHYKGKIEEIIKLVNSSITGQMIL